MNFAQRQQGQLPAFLDKKFVKDLNADERTLLLETVAVVSADATLGDARARMNVVPRCHDVIVTQTGSATDPVVGWLTNTDLAAVSD
jgi:hypothetical protein